MSILLRAGLLATSMAAVHLCVALQVAGQCVVADCTPAALATAISNCAVVRLACNGEIALPARIRVDRDLTLDGTGASVSLRRAGNDRLFQVASNATLTLVNLTFANSASSNIGAVFQNDGRIVAQGCVFRGNTARGVNAGIPSPFFAGNISGGVVYQRTGAVFVATGCLFTNNAAIGGNGLSSGSGGSTWGGAGWGGVGYFAGGLGMFTNCQFLGNSAVGGTGYDQGGSAFGGALLFEAGATGAVASCTFSNNAARCPGSVVAGFPWAEGGAIWAANQIQLSSCSFFDNTAATTNGGPAHGGAVHSEGLLWADQCTFQRNTAKGGSVGPNATGLQPGGPAIGGAVCNEGTAAVVNCFFELNSAKAGAGGLQRVTSLPTAGGPAMGGGCGSLGSNSVVWFTNCSLVRHTAQGGDGGRYFSVANADEARGAAVYLTGSGGLINCTVALSTNLGGQGGTPFLGGNGGAARGALAFFSGTGLVAHCTIATNQVVGGAGASPGWAQGAAIYAFGARVELQANIIAGAFGSTNLTGTNVDLGFNLCSDASLQPATPTTVTLVNPWLGPPAHNGGIGQTLALLPGSPALDAMPSASPGVPSTDQRGVARPQGAALDIGAFELGPPGTPAMRASLSGAAPVISLIGDAGHRYRLWGCSNLSAAPAWSIIATNLAQSNGPAAFVLPPTASPQFFRAAPL